MYVYHYDISQFLGDMSYETRLLLPIIVNLEKHQI